MSDDQDKKPETCTCCRGRPISPRLTSLCAKCAHNAIRGMEWFAATGGTDLAVAERWRDSP